MPRVQGRIFTDPACPELPPRERAAAYAAMASTLAALHSVAPGDVGLERYGRPSGYCRRQVGSAAASPPSNAEKRWKAQHACMSLVSICRRPRPCTCRGDSRSVPPPAHARPLLHRFYPHGSCAPCMASTHARRLAVADCAAQVACHRNAGSWGRSPQPCCAGVALGAAVQEPGGGAAAARDDVTRLLAGG